MNLSTGLSFDTHTHTYNRLTTFFPGQPGYQNDKPLDFAEARDDGVLAYHSWSFHWALANEHWYQKDKPIWTFWSRDDGVAVASAEPYASHLHLAPDR